MMEIPDGLLEAIAMDRGRFGGELQEYGVEIGKLYTDHGLPIDMAFDRLDHPKQYKIAILQGALWWLVEHKRNSGATEKSIERQRKLNRQYMESFIKTGEVGIY